MQRALESIALKAERPVSFTDQQPQIERRFGTLKCPIIVKPLPPVGFRAVI
jgi:hypothetical protein